MTDAPEAADFKKEGYPMSADACSQTAIQAKGERVAGPPEQTSQASAQPC